MRQGDILAVHPDYFQLTGGLERWLYRLARKAVPDKAEPPAIRFKMETLHERSGVTRDLKLFAFDIRKLAETQPLPEYGIQIEYRKGRREIVTLYRDKAKPCRPPRGRRLKTVRGEQVEPTANLGRLRSGGTAAFCHRAGQLCRQSPRYFMATFEEGPVTPDERREIKRILSSPSKQARERLLAKI